ncbi:hypothetical protein [Alistipes sp. AF48-12]|uniref:hypothetical protein n=1 Tax=Alistipes sp. AF48-12 TaxID=2291998 RepID=UPI0015FA58AD|nr:hypothetical protein [Alistipes sp. AF48-12]
MKSSGAIKERPRFFVIVVLLLGVLVVNELLVRAGTVQALHSCCCRFSRCWVSLSH